MLIRQKYQKPALLFDKNTYFCVEILLLEKYGKRKANDSSINMEYQRRIYMRDICASRY